MVSRVEPLDFNTHEAFDQTVLRIEEAQGVVEKSCKLVGKSFTALIQFGELISGLSAVIGIAGFVSNLYSLYAEPETRGETLLDLGENGARVSLELSSFTHFSAHIGRLAEVVEYLADYFLGIGAAFLTISVARKAHTHRKLNRLLGRVKKKDEQVTPKLLYKQMNLTGKVAMRLHRDINKDATKKLLERDITWKKNLIAATAVRHALLAISITFLLAFPPSSVVIFPILVIATIARLGISLTSQYHAKSLGDRLSLQLNEGRGTEARKTSRLVNYLWFITPKSYLINYGVDVTPETYQMSLEIADLAVEDDADHHQLFYYLRVVAVNLDANMNQAVDVYTGKKERTNLSYEQKNVISENFKEKLPKYADAFEVAYYESISPSSGLVDKDLLIANLIKGLRKEKRKNQLKALKLLQESLRA